MVEAFFVFCFELRTEKMGEEERGKEVSIWRRALFVRTYVRTDL